jgi:hypothetical protein
MDFHRTSGTWQDLLRRVASTPITIDNEGQAASYEMIGGLPDNWEDIYASGNWWSCMDGKMYGEGAG